MGSPLYVLFEQEGHFSAEISALFLMQKPIGAGGDPLPGLENAGEVKTVAESDRLGNTINGIARLLQQQASPFYTPDLQVFVQRMAHLSLEMAIEGANTHPDYSRQFFIGDDCSKVILNIVNGLENTRISA